MSQSSSDRVRRFKDIADLKDQEQEHVLFALDAMIQRVKVEGGGNVSYEIYLGYC